MKLEPKIKEKTWNKRLEDSVRKRWERKNIYKFKPGRKNFSIDTPPPYPSGRPWHIGAAAHYSQIDMVARAARMLGFSVFFPIGIDRNGLPVEIYTEKKYNVKLQDVTRDKFVSLCVNALDDLEAEMIGIMKTMGLSGDFDNYYRTDSEAYRALTQATFIELWNRGLIYIDKRPNNYCIDCGTTIADAEIVYNEVPTELIYVKWKIKDGKDNDEITIATTRPELICSCQVVMVNPGDSRYKGIVGKKAVLPIYNREVPIISHPSVDPAFGSGIVMMCSYGDYSDVRIFRELNLKEIIAIDDKGKMTENAGRYSGLQVTEARKKIIEDLGELIDKKERIMHRTPICDRSKTPIEIIPMNEFYLKQLDFVNEIKKIAKGMIFYPKSHRQILLDWIDSISIDWPISRRRFYGTEIPIWYCKKCGKACVPKPGKYYKPWKEEPPFKQCGCGSTDFRGEERTFDTWMDSSISPLFISRYKKDEKFFNKVYPNTIRPQAKDIIRTWLYYTLLRCYQLTKKPAFGSAWIMGYGVDEAGKKMSKSKGNVLDPIPILESYGADTFRYWNASESSLGSDFRCSEERISSNNKFLTKIWNVSRFISAFPHQAVKKGELKESDKWILYELDKTVSKCMKGYKEFNFFIPANEIRDFIWNIFAPYYIELVKARAYSGDRAAWHTLHMCMKKILLLLAPITPYMSDYIWNALYSKGSIHTEKFPEVSKEKTKLKTAELIMLITNIWKAKKDAGLSLKAEVKELTVPKKFKPIEKDLVASHNVKKIKYGNKISVVV
jgi:valyl-tRNA synthetase